MAQDPLSIPATILPESTFDPVQFAKERRQEVLTEQKERRERYNKAWESVGTPSEFNGNVQQELMGERNQIFEEGAAKGAKGINLMDVSHPKYGKDAMDFLTRLKRLDQRIDQSNALDQYLATVRQTIAKDVNGVIDVDATNKNIDKLRSLKNMDEVNQFMSEKGDNLIELKPPQFDMDQHIVDYLKSHGVKGMETSYETPKGSYLITEKYNEIPPEELRAAFSGMLQDPSFRTKVKEMRAGDASDLRGGSDLDYLMERKGNRLARQQTGYKKDWVKPEKADKEEQMVNQTSEPEKLNIIYQSGGKDKIYTVTGENTYTYNQSKTPNLRLGGGVIDANTGKAESPKDFVDFTPISSSEYYYAKTKLKGGPDGGYWKEGTILSDSPNNRANPDARKRRYVLGTYIEGTGDNAAKKTVLVPYANIKNTLDKIYDVKGGLPEPKEETGLSQEDQQAYDWAKQNPNDPRAKKILTLLNKK